MPLQGPQPGGAQQQHQGAAARPANEGAPQGVQQPEGAAQQPHGAVGEQPPGAVPAAAGDALLQLTYNYHNVGTGLQKEDEQAL